MPLYEYRCEACGKRHEALQRMDDPPLAVCPHCGGALRKLFSAPSFQFKGSGWYQTDYARKSGAESGDAKAGGGDAAPSAPSAPSSDSGGDSGGGKPAATETAAKPPSKPAGD